MKHTLYTIGLFLAIAFTSCYDNIDQSEDISAIEEDTPILATTIITGSLLDQGESLDQYQLLVNDQTISIDQKIFLEEIEDINKKGQAIYALIDGQEVSMMHTQLIENDINLIQLERFDPMNSNSIASSGPFMITPKVRLHMDTDILVDDQGNAVSHESYIDHRDLSSLDHIGQVGLTGYLRSGELVVTSHQTAFQLQARDANGNPLGISNGRSAQLMVDVDQENSSLFWLDRDQERWIEIRSLQQGANDITITAFGYYTVSTHQSAIYHEGEVNREGDRVAYQLLQSSAGSHQHQSYTTAKGRWYTAIPADEDVQYTTINPCLDIMESHEVPSSNSDVSGIDIEVEDTHYYRLRSKIIDCNGEVENTSGVSLHHVGRSVIYPFSQAEIDTWVPVCADEFGLSAYDIDTDDEGPQIPWSLQIEEDDNYLSNCAAYADGYSYIKIDDDKEVLSAFETVELTDETILASIDDKIRFKFDGMSTGMYSMEDVNLYLNDESFGTNGYFISCENSSAGCGFTDWNVTHYKAGEEKWIRVSFRGTVWMQTIDPPVAGYYDMEGVILTQAE